MVKKFRLRKLCPTYWMPAHFHFVEIGERYRGGRGGDASNDIDNQNVFLCQNNDILIIQNAKSLSALIY